MTRGKWIVAIITGTILGLFVAAAINGGSSTPSTAVAHAKPTQHVTHHSTMHHPTAPTATETAVPTDTSTPTADQWAADASQDTYTQVNDHPDLYQGDKVVWQCTIAKFLGDDPNMLGNTDVGCMVHLGDFNDQEIVLNVPPTIDTSQMDTNDNLMVYGTVDLPWQGKTALGVDSSWTQIDAVYLIDARIPTPTPPPTDTPTPVPTLTSAQAAHVRVVSIFDTKGHMYPRYHVVKSVVGSCWEGSVFDSQPSAWRCTAGSQIYDPCFNNPYALSMTAPVICPKGPWDTAVTEMRLTAPMPIQLVNHGTPGYGLPWGIALQSGERCTPLGGATFTVGDLRQNYACSPTGSIYGGITEQANRWTVLVWRGSTGTVPRRQQLAASVVRMAVW